MQKNNSVIKKIKDAVEETVHLVVDTENRRMLIAISICLVIVVFLGARAQHEISSFIGVADSRETIINFEFPVTVQRLAVMTGQAVQKGQLIAELDQPELGFKIETARAQLDKLVAQQNLVNEMSRIGTVRSKHSRKIRPDNNVNDARTNPLATEIASLRQEIKILENRERSLYVFAEISGVIGSVNYKKGETLPSYASLMTISPNNPSFIDGFMHESLETKIKVGQKVTVSSAANPDRSVEGHIATIGSRIVELPTRIARVQNHKVWGREIVVEIPPVNPFLLGEKVEISQPFSLFSLPVARASTEDAAPTKSADALVPQEIQLPGSLKAKLSFEPSGAIYLKDLRKFAIISDDTDSVHTPFIFLMNGDGSVDTNAVRIAGLDEIRDLESIFQDDKGEIYLLSSQSLTKKGKDKDARDLLVHVHRQGLQFAAQNSVHLRPLLLEALMNSSISELKAVKSKFAAELEIEGAFIANGNLNVSLKKPLLQDGSSAVLDLGSISALQTSKSLKAGTVKLSRKISFPVTEEKTTRISDMIKVGNELLISTVSHHPGSVGRVWSMNLDSGKLIRLNEFRGLNPEGLAFDSDSKNLMVVFDQKSKPGLFFRNSTYKLN